MTCFLLAFTLARRVSELYDLSFHVWHSRGWKSCTFSYVHDIVAWTQNPSIRDPRFEEFTIPCLDVLQMVIGSTCHMWSMAILEYPVCPNNQKEEKVSRNTISPWIRQSSAMHVGLIRRRIADGLG